MITGRFGGEEVMGSAGGESDAHEQQTLSQLVNKEQSLLAEHAQDSSSIY